MWENPGPIFIRGFSNQENPLSEFGFIDSFSERKFFWIFPQLPCLRILFPSEP